MKDQIMDKENNFNTFLKLKKEKGIPERFLPLIEKDERVRISKLYLGYPTYRHREEEKHRLFTFEEYKRLFERVKKCHIPIDSEMEFDEDWHAQILELCEQSYSYQQKYWKDWEWDHLWAHAFSEDGHLPTQW